MHRKLANFLVVTALTLLASPSLHGDIAISISSEVTSAGDVVDVTISARNTNGTAGSVLTAYDIPLSIEGFGSELSFVEFESSIFDAANSVTTPGVPPFNYDFQVVESDTTGVGVAIGSSPVDLVTLSFAVNESAPVGSEFDISIITDPSPVPSAFNIDGVEIGTEATAEAEAGVVRIVGTAVPEPSSGIMLTSLFLGVAARRRKRA